MNRKKLFRAVVPALTLTIAAAACGTGSGTTKRAPAAKSTSAASPTSAALSASQTGASALRSGLTSLLSEHVSLAALATGAALRGDDAGFTRYATALNGPTNSNTSDLVAAITTAYGQDVGTAFDGLWRSEKHIPQFVAYTRAVAKGDEAGKAAAVKELTSYATTFGQTLHQVNANLPADAVTQDIVMHATTLLKVIDAQKAGDQTAVYATLHDAYVHMEGTAKVLAVATAAKLPAKFDGDAAAPAAELRAGLTGLLSEHVWLAANATDAALGGRTDQFNAAVAALNGPTGSNTSALVDAIAGVYGKEVGTAFDGLWRSAKHIPQFVAYTQAVAKGDEAGKQAALKELESYATTFGTTLNQVNTNLPADAVTKDIVMHATTLTAVIDAQKTGSPMTADLLRKAVAHMATTADVLAAATVRKYPAKF